MTKTTFFRWLKGTLPPRSIRCYRSCPRYVDCRVARFGHTRHSGMIVLVSPKSKESTERHAQKYERWLREFEKREAADAAGGDDEQT